MRVFLVLLSIAALLMSLGTCAVAKGAVHEIYGGLWLLMAVVFFVGAAVLEELQRIRKALEPAPAPKAPATPKVQPASAG